LGQVGVNQFFAIRRGGSNDNAARVDDGGAAAKPQVIVFPDTIRRNYISLVFDRARLREHAPMFDSREWPRGRNKKSADVLLSYEFSVHLGEPQIVANAETKAQFAERIRVASRVGPHFRLVPHDAMADFEATLLGFRPLRNVLKDLSPRRWSLSRECSTETADEC